MAVNNSLKLVLKLLDVNSKPQVKLFRKLIINNKYCQ